MVPEGWETVRLNEVSRVRGETSCPSTDDARPYVALEHIAQREPRLLGWAVAKDAASTKAVFRAGELLFGKLRPNLRKAVLAPFDGVCSTDILPISALAALEPRYLECLAHSAAWEEHAIRTASGTKMPRTSWGLLGELRILLPPLPEQRKIAAILTSVDQAIEATQQVVDQLQVVKRSMMQELLTRGIPGRHKRFKQTEIGEVPEGWEVARVGDLGPPDRATAQTGPFGAQLSAEDFTEDGVPVLKIGNVQWGYLKLDALDHVSSAKASELQRFRVRSGDLLFARQGATTGRNALADDRCEGWLINYHIIRVATDNSRCIPEFLMACFNSPLVQRQVGQEKGRGNRDGINTGNILAFQLPLPPIEEQREIAILLRSNQEAVELNQATCEHLRGLKSALMSVLLTGEVRVKPDPEEAA